MEHTNEFLMGMFAAYMGCKVQSKISGSTYKTIGISYRESCFIVCNGDMVSKGDLHLYPKDLMPILTPLSEITDEDAVEVAKICKVPKIDRLGWGKEFIAYWLDGKIDDLKVSNSELQNIIDYLRLKKYDCGYLHIKFLIEAGLAVKATK